MAENRRATARRHVGRFPGVANPTARAALTRFVQGVAVNQITAHRDEAGQLMRIEVDYMDQIYDPSPRQVSISYEKAATHRSPKS